MRFELFISWRYLSSMRKQSLLLNRIFSVVGVGAGVMILIVVLSVMGGFERELEEKLMGTFSHLTIHSTRGNMHDYQEVLDRVLLVDGVTAGAPFITGQALLRAHGKAMGFVVRGIDPKKEQEVSAISRYIVKGGLDFQGDGIILGEELSKRLGLLEGDVAKIISPSQVQTPSGPVQIVVESEVVGIFDSGMYEYDANMAYVSLDTAQKLFRIGGGVSGLSLSTDKLEKAHDLKKSLRVLLGSSYRVLGWMDLNPTLFSAVKMEKKVMFIILIFIILVAALNIISTLIMMVMVKTKDIGILKALGCSSRSVMTIFTLEGFIIGVMGVIFGVLAGVWFAANINPIADFVGQVTGFQLFPSDVYYFDRIPADIFMKDVVVISLCAVAMSICAALYPSWKASRLKPVEALRYE
ncbi:MAG: lipoprotein-releasing ABC transporter permease subunit [Candidatus Tritonobacter lacicola]|nr:lipoprotein-releasing ABC transporter permease subunit [Candidatus Tritonobacter lacicola]